MVYVPLLLLIAATGQVAGIERLPPVLSERTGGREIVAVGYDWPGSDPIVPEPLIDPAPAPELPTLPRTQESFDLNSQPLVGEEAPWLQDTKPTDLSVWQQVKADYRNFYSTSRLGQNLVVFGVAASLAETNADAWARNEWQNDVRSPFTDRFADDVRWMGEWKMIAPAFFCAWAAAEWFPVNGDEGLWREWSRRTARSYLVGCPPMLAMQFITGGSRPGETDHGSDWYPFSDNNGVSGHAFCGAVPFMAAAQMTDDWRLKTVFYATSTLTGLSRINDDAHYTSQVLLGLWMSYWATQSVSETQMGHYRLLWAPTLVGDGFGLSLIGRW